ncbi:MAG: hypothetical protein HOV80_29770 [Polyangiaceae bacterium]|nr:hypothetical protein [Polyangiaceae bacterium]
MERRRGLEAFGIGEAELADYARRTSVRVITPDADAGELLHVLSSLERRSSRWDDDVNGAREGGDSAGAAGIDPASNRDRCDLGPQA